MTGGCGKSLQEMSWALVSRAVDQTGRHGCMKFIENQLSPVHNAEPDARYLALLVAEGAAIFAHPVCAHPSRAPAPAAALGARSRCRQRPRVLAPRGCVPPPCRRKPTKALRCPWGIRRRLRTRRSPRLPPRRALPRSRRRAPLLGRASRRFWRRRHPSRLRRASETRRREWPPTRRSPGMRLPRRFDRASSLLTKAALAHLETLAGAPRAVLQFHARRRRAGAAARAC